MDAVLPKRYVQDCKHKAEYTAALVGEGGLMAWQNQPRVGIPVARATAAPGVRHTIHWT